MDNLHIQNNRESFKVEENKQDQFGDQEALIDDPRPESTEIRIDPGGQTSTNFHKSNDAPFFFPEIKSKELYANPDNSPVINKQPMTRQEYTTSYANQNYNYYKSKMPPVRESHYSLGL